MRPWHFGQSDEPTPRRFVSRPRGKRLRVCGPGRQYTFGNQGAAQVGARRQSARAGALPICSPVGAERHVYQNARKAPSNPAGRVATYWRDQPDRPGMDSAQCAMMFFSKDLRPGGPQVTRVQPRETCGSCWLRFDPRKTPTGSSRRENQVIDSHGQPVRSRNPPKRSEIGIIVSDSAGTSGSWTGEDVNIRLACDPGRPRREPATFAPRLC